MYIFYHQFHDCYLLESHYISKKNQILKGLIIWLQPEDIMEREDDIISLSDSDIVVLSDTTEYDNDCSELLCDNMLKEDFDNFISDEVISDECLKEKQGLYKSIDSDFHQLSLSKSTSVASDLFKNNSEDHVLEKVENEKLSSHKAILLDDKIESFETELGCCSGNLSSLINNNASCEDKLSPACNIYPTSKVEVHECSKVSLNKDLKESEIVSKIISVNCNLNKDTLIDLKLTEEGKDNKHLEEVLIQAKDSSQESKVKRNSYSDMYSNKNFMQQEIVTQDDVDIVDPDLNKTNRNNSIVSKDDLNSTGSLENIFKNKLVNGNDYFEKNDESKIEDINTSNKLSSSLVKELIPKVVVSKLNQNEEPFIRDIRVSNAENFNTPKNAVSLLNNENFVKENFDFEYTNVTPEISLKHEKFSNCRVESPSSDNFLLEKNVHISDEQIHHPLDSQLITHEMLEEMVLKKVMHYNDDSIVASAQPISIKDKNCKSNEDITPTYDKFVNEVNGCVFGNNSHIADKLTSHSQDSELLITREILEEMVLNKVMHYDEDSIIPVQSINIKDEYCKSEDNKPPQNEFRTEVNKVACANASKDSNLENISEVIGKTKTVFNDEVKFKRKRGRPSLNSLDKLVAMKKSSLKTCSQVQNRIKGSSVTLQNSSLFYNTRKVMNKTCKSVENTLPQRKLRDRHKCNPCETSIVESRTKKFKVTVIFVDKVKEVVEIRKEPVKSSCDEQAVNNNCDIVTCDTSENETNAEVGMNINSREICTPEKNQLPNDMISNKNKEAKNNSKEGVFSNLKSKSVLHDLKIVKGVRKMKNKNKKDDLKRTEGLKDKKNKRKSVFKDILKTKKVIDDENENMSTDEAVDCKTEIDCERVETKDDKVLLENNLSISEKTLSLNKIISGASKCNKLIIRADTKSVLEENSCALKPEPREALYDSVENNIENSLSSHRESFNSTDLAGCQRGMKGTDDMVSNSSELKNLDKGTKSDDDISCNDCKGEDLRVKRRSLKLNFLMKQEVQEKCCGHWFPSKKRFIRHLIENSKMETDSLHAAKLIDIGMQMCKVCSVWLNSINMKKHLKIHPTQQEENVNKEVKEISFASKAFVHTKKEKEPMSDKQIEKPCPRSKKKNLNLFDYYEEIKCDLSLCSSEFKCITLHNLTDLPPLLNPSLLVQKYKGKIKKKLLISKKKMKFKCAVKNKNIKSLKINNSGKSKIDQDSDKQVVSENITAIAKNVVKTKPSLVNKGTLQDKKLLKKLIKKRQIKQLQEPTDVKEKNKLEKASRQSIKLEGEVKELEDTISEGRPSEDNRIRKNNVINCRKSQNIGIAKAPDETSKKLQKLNKLKRKENLRKKRRIGFHSSESSSSSSSESSYDDDDDDDLNFPPIIRENKLVPCEEHKETEESIPMVELDLITLPSFDDDFSVLLLDPKNPNFKVMASMDAVFVGDLALTDVTNHMGYVSDDNSVVYVSPNHFLFPVLKDSESKSPLQKKNSLIEKSKKKIFQECMKKPPKKSKVSLANNNNNNNNNNNKENSISKSQNIIELGKKSKLIKTKKLASDKLKKVVDSPSVCSVGYVQKDDAKKVPKISEEKSKSGQLEKEEKENLDNFTDVRVETVDNSDSKTSKFLERNSPITTNSPDVSGKELAHKSKEKFVIKIFTGIESKKVSKLEKEIQSCFKISSDRVSSRINGLPLSSKTDLSTLDRKYNTNLEILPNDSTLNFTQETDDYGNSCKILADSNNTIIPKFCLPSLDSLEVIDCISENNNKIKQLDSPENNEALKEIMTPSSLVLKNTNDVNLPPPDSLFKDSDQTLSPVHASSDSSVVVATAKILSFEEIEDGICLEDMMQESEVKDILLDTNPKVSDSFSKECTPELSSISKGLDNLNSNLHSESVPTLCSAPAGNIVKNNHDFKKSDEKLVSDQIKNLEREITQDVNTEAYELNWKPVKSEDNANGIDPMLTLHEFEFEGKLQSQFSNSEVNTSLKPKMVSCSSVSDINDIVKGKNIWNTPLINSPQNVSLKIVNDYFKLNEKKIPKNDKNFSYSPLQVQYRSLPRIPSKDHTSPDVKNSKGKSGRSRQFSGNSIDSKNKSSKKIKIKALANNVYEKHNSNVKVSPLKGKHNDGVKYNGSVIKNHSSQNLKVKTKSKLSNNMNEQSLIVANFKEAFNLPVQKQKRSYSKHDPQFREVKNQTKVKKAKSHSKKLLQKSQDILGKKSLVKSIDENEILSDQLKQFASSPSPNSLKMRICVKNFSKDALILNEEFRKKKRKRFKKKKKERDKFQNPHSAQESLFENSYSQSLHSKFTPLESCNESLGVSKTTDENVKDFSFSQDLNMFKNLHPHSKPVKPSFSSIRENKETKNNALSVPNNENVKEEVEETPKPLIVKHFDTNIFPPSNVSVESSENKVTVKKEESNEGSFNDSVSDNSLDFRNPEVSASSSVKSDIDSEDCRFWHSRNSKLKAQIKITDQQNGISNSLIEGDKYSTFNSKHRKKKDPGTSKDIRQYFVSSDNSGLKSPNFPKDQNKKKCNISLSLQSPSPSDTIKITPSSKKTPTSATKNPKSVKRKCPFSMDIRLFLNTDNVNSNLDCDSSQSKKLRLKIKTEKLEEESDFEGFDVCTKFSELRSKTLREYVDVLGTNLLFWDFDLPKLPLPMDQLCDWNDNQLNRALFEKG